MSHPLLRDPFYSQLAGSIGLTTAITDRMAHEKGQKFTDSQVNAVFHRVIRKLEGKPPKPKAPTSEKERLQQHLYDELLKLRETIYVTDRSTGEKNVLSKAHFLNAMRAAKASLESQRSGEPGERSYLEDSHAILTRVEASSAEEEQENAKAAAQAASE